MATIHFPGSVLKITRDGERIISSYVEEGEELVSDFIKRKHGQNAAPTVPEAPDEQNPLAPAAEPAAEPATEPVIEPVTEPVIEPEPAPEPVLTPAVPAPGTPDAPVASAE